MATQPMLSFLVVDATVQRFLVWAILFAVVSAIYYFFAFVTFQTKAEQEEAKAQDKKSQEEMMKLFGLDQASKDEKEKTRKESNKAIKLKKQQEEREELLGKAREHLSGLEVLLSTVQNDHLTNAHLKGDFVVSARKNLLESAAIISKLMNDVHGIQKDVKGKQRTLVSHLSKELGEIRRWIRGYILRDVNHLTRFKKNSSEFQTNAGKIRDTLNIIRGKVMRMHSVIDQFIDEDKHALEDDLATIDADIQKIRNQMKQRTAIPKDDINLVKNMDGNLQKAIDKLSDYVSSNNLSDFHLAISKLSKVSNDLKSNLSSFPSLDGSSKSRQDFLIDVEKMIFHLNSVGHHHSSIKPAAKAIYQHLYAHLKNVYSADLPGVYSFPPNLN